MFEHISKSGLVKLETVKFHLALHLNPPTCSNPEPWTPPSMTTDVVSAGTRFKQISETVIFVSPSVQSQTNQISSDQVSEKKN